MRRFQCKWDLTYWLIMCVLILVTDEANLENPNQQMLPAFQTIYLYEVQANCRT